jgi:enamine deaminase RidA (YjgF/YER057c/UK114 family)
MQQAMVMLAGFGLHLRSPARPTWTCVGVTDLVCDAPIEIDGIAKR